MRKSAAPVRSISGVGCCIIGRVAAQMIRPAGVKVSLLRERIVAVDHRCAFSKATHSATMRLDPSGSIPASCVETTFQGRECRTPA